MLRNETTPTGIPIIDCDYCHKRHPITRHHCANCKAPSLFVTFEGANCRRCD